MLAKNLNAGLGNSRVFSTQHYLGPWGRVLLVSGSDPKEHLTFTNYDHHREWNFNLNNSIDSKSTNSIPVTSSLTFRNNGTGVRCEHLTQ
jgi:hypothetical protein